MKKSKKVNFQCKCGFQCYTRKQLIEHCMKNHTNDPYMIYDMIGDVGSIKNANAIVDMLQSKLLNNTTKYQDSIKENIKLIDQLVEKDKEIEKLKNLIKKLELAMVSISTTINLYTESIKK